MKTGGPVQKREWEGEPPAVCCRLCFSSDPSRRKGGKEHNFSSLSRWKGGGYWVLRK